APSAADIPPAQKPSADAAFEKAEAFTDAAGEATDDDVVMGLVDAGEHDEGDDNLAVADNASVATPAPAPVSTPPKPAPSIALYQPRPLPRVETVVTSGDYEYPPRDLLQEVPSLEGNIITQEMLERSAGLLESVLE